MIISSAIESGYPRYALPLPDHLSWSNDSESSLPDSEFLHEANGSGQSDEKQDGKSIEQLARKKGKIERKDKKLQNGG